MFSIIDMNCNFIAANRHIIYKRATFIFDCSSDLQIILERSICNYDNKKGQIINLTKLIETYTEKIVENM